MFKYWLLIIMLFPLGGRAQIKASAADTVLTNIENRAEEYSKNHVDEKVYLHLSKSAYNAGDTAWFKAYVVAGKNHHLSNLSGVLYAEMVDQNGSVLQRLNLQLDGGLTTGDFLIPVETLAGPYHIKAYTKWMLNDSSNYFDQKITVLPLAAQQDLGAGKSDDVINQAAFTVQFFPEGGRLINDLRTKVAVKFTQNNKAIENSDGVITDDSGNELASFTTQHGGLGVFALKPQSGKHYKAKLTFAGNGKYECNLPEAENSGITLGINAIGDTLYVKIAANDVYFKSNKGTSFYILAQSAGEYYYSTAAKLDEPVFTASLNKMRFPAGIARFTLFSRAGQPICERLVFIRNNDQLKLKIDGLKAAYQQGEPVKLTIATKNGNEAPVPTSLSIAITNEDLLNKDLTKENSIISSLLLSADLKEHIADAGYYFTHYSEEEQSGLDLLLLTQQYNKYNWKKILSPDNVKEIYLPEKGLSINGLIRSTDGQPLAGVKISMTCITENFMADTITDANGKFIFENVNLTGRAKLFLQAQVKDKSEVNIYVQQPEYLKEDNATSSESITGLNNESQTNNQLKQNGISNKAIGLKEVKINSTKKEKASLNNKYGTDNPYTIPGSKLIDMGPLSMGLAAKLPAISYKDGKFYSLKGFPSPQLHIVLNNHEIDPQEINSSIDPADVENVKILEGRSYKIMYGVASDPRANDNDDIVLITTKQFAGTVKTLPIKSKSVALNISDISGSLKTKVFTTTIGPSNTINYVFSGYYDPNQVNFTIPSASSVYWKPDIITNENGNATVSYITKLKGKYKITIDGIDGNGNLTFIVMQYKVE